MNEKEKQINSLENSDSIEKNKDEKNLEKENAEINIEELAKSSTVEMEKETENLSFEKSEKELGDSVDSIELDPKIQKAELENSEVLEKLKIISEKATNLLENAKSGIKKVIAGGMATMAFFGAGDFKEAKAMESKEALKIEEFENNSEKYENLLKEIGLNALNEKNERVFFIARDKNNIKFLKDISGNNQNCFISFEKINNLIKNCDSLDVIHTHVAEGDYYLNDVEKIKKGEIVEYQPSPPSITDLKGTLSQIEAFGDNHKKIENKVIESFGVWDFSYDENSSFVNFLKEKQNSEIHIFGVLDQEEIELLDKKVEENFDFLKNVHSALVAGELISLLRADKNNDIKNIGDKLAKNIEEKEKELSNKYPKETKVFEKILNNEMLSSRFYGGKLAIEKTRENINLLKENGIILNYKPFEKQNE